MPRTCSIHHSVFGIQHLCAALVEIASVARDLISFLAPRFSPLAPKRAQQSTYPRPIWPTPNNTCFPTQCAKGDQNKMCVVERGILGASPPRGQPSHGLEAHAAQRHRTRRLPRRRRRLRRHQDAFDEARVDVAFQEFGLLEDALV